MSFNPKQLTDDELMGLINGQDMQLSSGSSSDINKMSDDDLLKAIDSFGGRPNQTVGTLGSIGLGAIEGATDLLALGELAANKLAPEKPEGLITSSDYDSLILNPVMDRLEEDPSSVSPWELFSAIYASSDSDEPVAPSMYGPSAKQKEELTEEQLYPIATFQSQLPQSDDEISNILRRGARFGTGALTTGAGLGTAARVAGMGLAGQTLREVGAGEPLAIFTELGGPGFLKNLIKARTGKSAPAAVIEDVKKAAKQLGTDAIPVGAVTTNKAVQFLDNVVSQSSFGKKAYESLFNELRGDLSKNFNNVLEGVSSKRLSSLAQGGESLQAEFAKAHRQSRAYSRAAYGFAENSAKGIRAPVDDVIRGLEATNKRMAETFLKESKEAGVQNVISKLLAELKKSKKAGTVDLSRLVATRRSIRSMINYDDIGGAKELLKSVDNNLTKNFERIGRRNPQWYSRFKSAETNFKDQAKYFRNRLMRTVLFGESPEGIVNAINKPSDLAKLESALNTKGINPQTKESAREVVQAIKRRKFEDMMLDKVVDPNFQVNLGKRPAFTKQNREFLESLLPKEGKQTLRNIETIREQVSKAAAEFANTSRTAANAQDIALMMQLLSGAKKLIFGGNIAGAAASTTLPASVWVGSKILTSKAMTRRMLNLQQAVRAKDPNRFNAIASQLAAEFNRYVDQSGTDKEDLRGEFK